MKWTDPIPPRNTALDKTNGYYAGRGSDDLRLALRQLLIGIGVSLAAVVVIVAIQSLV